MRRDADTLRETVRAVLLAHGVPDAHAVTQGDLLLEAQMRGYPSHGLMRLPRIVERIVNGVSAPAASGSHEWIGDSFLRVDGERGLGPVVAVSALAALQEKARKTGIAIGAIRN